jgi:hypothetical protein
MRTSLAFFAIGAGLLALPACAPTGSTSTGLSGTQSPALRSSAIPRPWSTPLYQPSRGQKPLGWICKNCSLKSVIYVAASDRVVIYPESGSDAAPIGAVSNQVGGAWGLFVDAKHDLFVANNGSVTAYHSGELSPYIHYSDGNRPMYVVTDPTGRLYAANRNGTVTEYRAGQTKPDRTLTTPGVEADGINLDFANNLYVAYRGQSGVGSIEEFAPNSSKGRVLGMQIVAPQGLQLDHSGNILVVETDNKQDVEIFPPGSQTPSQVIAVVDGVEQIVLREAQEQMYISNFIDNNVYISPYPQSDFQLKIDSGLGGVQGMALSNGAP